MISSILPFLPMMKYSELVSIAVIIAEAPNSLSRRCSALSRMFMGKMNLFLFLANIILSFSFNNFILPLSIKFDKNLA